MQNLVDQFKSEHQQFVKCIRNFSAMGKSSSGRILNQDEAKRQQIIIKQSFNHLSEKADAIQLRQGQGHGRNMGDQRSAPIVVDPKASSQAPYVLA